MNDLNHVWFGFRVLQNRRIMNNLDFTNTGTYQVNVSESVDGDITPWISEWSNDGYVGKLVDTTYLDGSDTTDWCVFVGTRSECEAYIRRCYERIH